MRSRIRQEEEIDARDYILRRRCAALAFVGVARGVITVDGTEQPQYTSITNQLALSHGVTFSSTMPFVTFGDNGVNVPGIYGTDPTSNPFANYAFYGSPIEVTFVDMSDGVSPVVVNGTVSAVFGDGGGDTDGIRLRAYDISNNLIGTQTALSVSFGPISITGTGIRKVIFDQSGLGAGTSDTFLDSLSYDNPTPVPEPGTCAVLGVGLLALMAGRRR